jgi:hypothetical protein
MEFLLALKCCILDQANSESYFVGNSREIMTSGIGRVGVCMANADGGKLGIRGTVNPEMNLSIDPRPHIDRAHYSCSSVLDFPLLKNPKYWITLFQSHRG